MNHALATTGAEGVEIFMSALSVTARPQRGTLGDLAAMWVALFAALAYLDVPLRNAPLFAMAIVLQAALGAYVITRLLDGLRPSLLLLCGPGLILGGALSFAVFQIVGRGTVGIFVTTGVGLIAAFMVSQQVPSNAESPRIWILTQILGLAGLALVIEFSELLPITIAFFILAYVLDPSRPRPVFLQVALISATACVIVFTLSVRQKYWWLVTDDYQYFEVISHHVTQSGPTTDWGVLNFFKYHWLSYGWSGLLDIVGGSPAPLVTLTRIMPITYSMALGASLILIGGLFQKRTPTTANLNSAWVVIAIAHLDWSGTSTAGVYAVLSGFAFLFLRTFAQKKLGFRGLILLGVFASILALTKLPALFAMLVFALVSIANRLANRFQRPALRSTLSWAGTVLAVCVATSLVWLVGPSLGLSLELLKVNSGLGQIGDLSKTFASVAMILLRLPLWILVVTAAVKYRSNSVSAIKSQMPDYSKFIIFLLAGLVWETSIFGISSNHFEYVSGPMYFVASLSVLALSVNGSTNLRSSEDGRLTMSLTATTIGLALLWTSQFGSSRFWNLIGKRLTVISDSSISILQFATSDGRTAVIVGGTLLVVVSLVFGRRLNLARVLLTPLVVMTFADIRSSSLNSFRNELTANDLSPYLGSADLRTIAGELGRISQESDLIATNHLFDEQGNKLGDFSLAVWSQREFLVLGPRFGSGSEMRKLQAIEKSIGFADSPTPESCDELWGLGVRWFVVDLKLTQTRDWSVCSELVFAAENYLLLLLHDIPDSSSS